MAIGRKTGGRQKNTPNKVNKALKEMILGALDAKDGQTWLEQQMDANPVAFMSLLGRVLPTTLQGDKEQPVEISITRDVVRP